MSVLVIVTASFPRFHSAQAIAVLIARFLITKSPSALAQATVIYPSESAIDTSIFAEGIPYAPAIGLEANQDLWRSLRQKEFEEIFIFGIDEFADYGEIILACYLDAPTKSYLSRHGIRDLTEWQAQVRPDLRPREAVLHRLGDDRQKQLIQGINRWLADQIVQSDFNLPGGAAVRHPDVLLYQEPRLALDLAEQAYGLERGVYGNSWSTFFCLDGFLVHSSDYFRALANFVMSVDGIETVLDVGCGSGLLASHLAAAGRYRAVTGIDASPQRIDGARLFAELNGSAARFDVMSMTDIRLPDRSVDLSVTSFALEQSGEHLARCLSEIRRVTRKLMILLEPTNEFFPSFASLWHVPLCGWANRYHPELTKLGLAFAVRPTLLFHYTNPGSIFVIDLESREHPALRYPKLFGLGCADWPGGVQII